MEPLDRLKQATRWMWSLGDYSAVAALLEPYARMLADDCEIRPGAAVLDVAAGNGNFAIAAAERGARVVASDITPQMLELGRGRTAGAGLDVGWHEADAEDLPFTDGAFDVVASVFGAMFAPRPDRVAREMFRVCRKDGLVAMANYGWDGFLGGTARLLEKFSTPLPFELPSPFEWGDPDVVRRRFADYAADVLVELHELSMKFDSVDAALAFWERTNGPVLAMHAMAPPERYAEVRAELRRLMESTHLRTGTGIELRSSYVTVLARR